MVSTQPQSSQPFADAFAVAWGKLKPHEQEAFSKPVSITDVYAETTKIQKQQGKTGGMRNTNKIRKYVDGLRQYSDVINVFVQAKPEILSLVWVISFNMMMLSILSDDDIHLGPDCASAESLRFRPWSYFNFFSRCDGRSRAIISSATTSSWMSSPKSASHFLNFWR